MDSVKQQRVRRFGVSPDQYRAMLLAQNGVCALCRLPETSKRNGTLKTLAVDHDHNTGVVRGLLCYRCNTALGLLGDDLGRVRNAGDYLARFA